MWNISSLNVTLYTLKYAHHVIEYYNLDRSYLNGQETKAGREYRDHMFPFFFYKIAVVVMSVKSI